MITTQTVLGRLSIERCGCPSTSTAKAAPAALAVHMDLFGLVTDTLEQSAEDDPRWLEAAVDVLRHAEDAAAYDLRDVLVTIEHDYALSPPECNAIRAAVASIPPVPSCETSS
jgi:hypothetical protein